MTQSPQSEQALENALIEQLGTLGYSFVSIPDEAALKANLKTQLEKHNQTTFSDFEFQQIMHHLDKGNVFERAKILRDKMCLSRDNGETFYLNFMEMGEWCQNEYQVTNQVTIEGSYKNRYDVTLLVNGLPLVQIELNGVDWNSKKHSTKSIVISDILSEQAMVCFSMCSSLLSAMA